MTAVLRDPKRLFAEPLVERELRPDGTVLLRSPVPLGGYPDSICHYLDHWAAAAADRPFLLERSADGGWAGVTFGAARDVVRRLAAGLLARGLSSERPLVILSDNSVEQGILTLAGMLVGVPVVPVSPSYSLVSTDHAKLGRIVTLVQPGMVFAEDGARYRPALAAIRPIHDGVEVVGSRSVEAGGSIRVADLAAAADVGAGHGAARGDGAAGVDRATVDRAARAVGPDTIAKLLFTSGSTAEPKGVINTQRMLSANQQARAQVWPFLADHPPVIVDWLPWSHTFGGNHNFNLVLRQGGTLYIDGGRPAPPLFAQTVANLREISPTVYFNVPRGFDMLVSALRADRSLRENFFRRLQVIFYAAAALPQHLWEALEELALDTAGEAVPMVSAWGSTETAPMVTDCHFQASRSGVIGIPAPGCELKLVPNGDKLEVRVRGPNVTPGYWRRPDLTASQFDEEGFYRIGDAVRLVDPERPEQGLLFDGRVAEDFKLDSGTWVNVGMLRVRAIEALAPVAQDIVVTGHDRSEVGFLVFPNVAACRALAGDLAGDAPVERALAHSAVRDQVREGLAALKGMGGGSSMFATRAMLLAEPPSIDGGEITDKGYLNQRAVLDRRAALVERLHQESSDGAIVRLPRTG
ncbi:MAG: feruloyl-CoA synthase [Gemmatimonadales bacterium]